MLQYCSRTKVGPTLGSQLESILAIKLLEDSLLNQMNMALVENVNVLETCMEAVTSEFIFKIFSVRKDPSDDVS